MECGALFLGRDAFCGQIPTEGRLTRHTPKGAGSLSKKWAESTICCEKAGWKKLVNHNL
jgi:hypothetical protein